MRRDSHLDLFEDHELIFKIENRNVAQINMIYLGNDFPNSGFGTVKYSQQSIARMSKKSEVHKASTPVGRRPDGPEYSFGGFPTGTAADLDRDGRGRH